MSNYWQKRFQAVEEMNNKRAKETVQSITPAFDQAQAQIEKEINAWYARFAKNNQISLQEAKKLLNTKELKEFRWDVEEYIKYGRQNAIDQQWMKQLENASARFHVSRLEALKIRTQNAAEVAFGNELDQLDQMAARLYMDDYYHTAYEIQRGLGIGFDVAQIDQRKLDNLLSKPWTADKMTFSDRIWKSKTQLIDSLHTELTQMCVLGKSPDQAINNIAKRMNVSKNQAGRLVMTESAYFASAAQKDCFNDLDVEKFEIVATLDSHTSEICQQMDGQVFDMKDFKAGVTAPPFHVWCRSCTCPWFEDNNDGKRAARGADGKTYYVPADMKYQDWKDHFVDKTKDPADWLRPATVEDISNISSNIADLLGVKEERIQLDELPYESQNIICTSVQESIDKFPQLKGHFNRIGVYGTTDALAVSNSLTGEIKVGKEFFDFEKLKKNYNYGTKLKWNPEGTSVKSIFTHEVGHQIDGLLTIKRIGGGYIDKFGAYRTSSEIQKQLFDEFGITDALKDFRKKYREQGFTGANLNHAVMFERKELIIKHSCEYAAENANELFACLYAEYMDSPSPRPMAKRFGEILEGLMGELK
jgi:SPP1 gp7 family putative phage head morphogenesis protein